MKKMFRKFFLVKEIRSQEGILHFQRWRILSTKYFSIYIHRIFKEDSDYHLHSHPWNYFSFILSGGYEEASLYYNSVEYKNMLPMSFSFRKHGTFHKINTLFKTTTTLFVTGERKYSWGYFVDGEVVANEDYRKNKHAGLYDLEIDKGWRELHKFKSIYKPRKFEL